MASRIRFTHRNAFARRILGDVIADRFDLPKSLVREADFMTGGRRERFKPIERFVRVVRPARVHIGQPAVDRSKRLGLFV